MSTETRRPRSGAAALAKRFFGRRFSRSVARSNEKEVDLSVQLGRDLPHGPLVMLTCGTIRGCCEYILDHGLHTRVVAVDAVGSLIFSQVQAKRLLPGLGAAGCSHLCARLPGSPIVSTYPIWTALSVAGAWCNGRPCCQGDLREGSWPQWSGIRTGFRKVLS